MAWMAWGNWQVILWMPSHAEWQGIRIITKNNGHSRLNFEFLKNKISRREIL